MQETYTQIEVTAHVVHQVYQIAIENGPNDDYFRYYDHKKFAKLTPDQLIDAIKDELFYFEEKFNSLALFILF